MGNTNITKAIIQVILVDDNPDDVFIINQLLAMEAQPRFKSFNVKSIIEIENLKNEMRIDAILLSLNDEKPLENISLCKRLVGAIPVVILSNDELEIDEEIIKRGAHDLIPKVYLTAESLSRAIRFACARRQYMSPLRIVETN